ncbi:MAG: 4-hydroxy-tetrahydrodipicolinate reductase [Bacteroidota bacterium]
MKIALIGYGKMGHLVEEVASRHDIEVVGHFTKDHPLRADESTRQALTGTKALLDFSAPDVIQQNIRAAAALSINLVVGTTGWHKHLNEARKIVDASNIGMIFGSNFSVGVNIFYKIVERSAELVSALDSYDPFIEETHHKSKRDAPSGTALMLQNILSKEFSTRRIPVTSVRAGFVPGTHAVSYDSTVDTILLQHTARSREGFAEGALLAAKWIVNRKGVYEFREVLDLILARSNS